MARDVDLFADSRVEEYWVEVQDRDGKPLGRLDGVKGGNVTCSTDARIKTGGKLQVEAKHPISWWGSKRLQVWVRVNGSEWPLGVFIPSSPQAGHKDSGTSFDVEIHDKLLVLDQDKLPQALSIPKDTNLVQWVVDTIRETGETNVKITPSETTNYRPLTWDAGTELLTVVNDILDFIGYFSLSCDGYGQYQSKPYVIPRERPVSWEFREGSSAVFSADFSFEQNLTDIPNRIVYTTQSTGVPVGGELNQEFMVAYAENLDPNSPYSYQARGRWITQVKTDAEAADQEELQKMVDKRLENAMEPMAKVEMKNAMLPLKLNDICFFDARDYQMYMSVRKWAVKLQAGELMSTTLRKVNKSLDEDGEG